MASLQRAEELPPNGLRIAETTNDDAMIMNGTLPRDPEKLAVTSSLPAFWHTKKGGLVIVLVILVLIGAIVGGAVGGAKTASDASM